MKIRLTGTRDEVDKVLPVLTSVLIVQEVSDFYPNRGTSLLGRVYLEVAEPRPNVVRAEAVRGDRPNQPRTAIEPNRQRGEIQ